jgi:hypothetical protein
VIWPTLRYDAAQENSWLGYRLGRFTGVPPPGTGGMDYSDDELTKPGCAQSGGMILSSYLVDPASSHMLVSKIKPCMS